MIHNRSVLTEADVRALVRSGDEAERAEAAYKICRRIDDQPLPPEERKAAQDILRLMAADAAESVRKALAVTLKASPLLPRDVDGERNNRCALHAQCRLHEMFVGDEVWIDQETRRSHRRHQSVLPPLAKSVPDSEMHRRRFVENVP